MGTESSLMIKRVAYLLGDQQTYEHASQCRGRDHSLIAAIEKDL